MVGQGSPPIRWLRGRLLARVAWGLVVFLRVVGSLSAADDLKLDLRCTWGGANPQVFAGEITVSAGAITKTAILGLEGDAPASVLATSDKAFKILPRSAHAFNGIDFTWQAPPDATITIKLKTGSNDPHTLTVNANELVSGYHGANLGDSGARVSLQRQATALIDFHCERANLVFKPGESWNCRWTPNLITEAAAATGTLKIALKNLTTQQVAYQSEQTISLDEQGSLPAGISTNVKLESPGVYEWHVEVKSKPLAAPLVRPKTWASRRVQAVVIDSAAPPVEDTSWHKVDEFDPTKTSSWQRGSALLEMWSASGTPKKPLGNQPLGKRDYLQKTWAMLEASAWHTYPLPIEQPQTPHMLEVEYPSDVPQSLAISIVEPNAAGQVIPLGLDSGFEVREPPSQEQPHVARHRLVFWPRTRSPLVLLVNRRDNTPALFGTVRVLAGPKTLPHDDAKQPARAKQRLAAIYFEKPLFPETFGVSETADARTGRLHDDWSTFAMAAERLAEYTRFAGFNSAVVSVQVEGSALYPSKVLDPTPKYDTSLFSDTSADPVRKDVLLAILREFHRRGLTFLPAISLASPLPELEELKLTGNQSDSVGIDLVGADGRTWSQSSVSQRGLGAYYNLLDPRVQAAVRRVVWEIVDRYKKEPALGGLVLQLTNDGFLQLPDEAWGLDDVTLLRFLRDTRLTPPDEAQQPHERWRWIQREARDAWLQWRAAKLEAFYRSLREDLEVARPGLKLVLCPLESFQNRRLEQLLRPRLPAQDHWPDALRQIGFASGSALGKGGPTFARAWRDAAACAPLLDPLALEAADAAALHEIATSCAEPACFMASDTLPLRLEAFDRVSPFGPTNTRLQLYSHLSPAGSEARQRFVRALAVADAQLLADGGWQPALGQEDAVRPLLNIFTQLPAESFTAVPAPPNARTQPVTFRRWSSDAETWFSLVNDSPWTTVVDIQLAADSALEITEIGANATRSLRAANGTAHWRVAVEPYSLSAARIGRGQVHVASWQTQVDMAIEVALREQIRQVRLRANALRAPQPLPALTNEGFELPARAADSFPGWLLARDAGVTIKRDEQQAASGKASLFMKSQSPSDGSAAAVAWVRSDPIPPPKTGRLALWAHLRTSKIDQQPLLRLAVEAKYEGQTYYRRANVGRSESGRGADKTRSGESSNEVQPLKQQWSPFLFPLDDLPTNGLSELRVGFDLMEPGECWIDDVLIYDSWFAETERDALVKNIALADFQLQAGQLSECQKMLGGYWAQYLRRHVTLAKDAVAALPTSAQSSAAEPGNSTVQPARGSGGRLFDRLKQWAPKAPFYSE